MWFQLKGITHSQDMDINWELCHYIYIYMFYSGTLSSLWQLFLIIIRHIHFIPLQQTSFSIKLTSYFSVANLQEWWPGCLQMTPKNDEISRRILAGLKYHFLPFMVSQLWFRTEVDRRKKYIWYVICVYNIYIYICVSIYIYTCVYVYLYLYIINTRWAPEPVVDRVK